MFYINSAFFKVCLWTYLEIVFLDGVPFLQIEQIVVNVLDIVSQQEWISDITQVYIFLEGYVVQILFTLGEV